MLTWFGSNILKNIVSVLPWNKKQTKFDIFNDYKHSQFNNK